MVGRHDRKKEWVRWAGLEGCAQRQADWQDRSTDPSARCVRSGRASGGAEQTSCTAKDKDGGPAMRRPATSRGPAAAHLQLPVYVAAQQPSHGGAKKSVPVRVTRKASGQAPCLARPPAVGLLAARRDGCHARARLGGGGGAIRGEVPKQERRQRPACQGRVPGLISSLTRRRLVEQQLHRRLGLGSCGQARRGTARGQQGHSAARWAGGRGRRAACAAPGCVIPSMQARLRNPSSAGMYMDVRAAGTPGLQAPRLRRPTRSSPATQASAMPADSGAARSHAGVGASSSGQQGASGRRDPASSQAVRIRSRGWRQSAQARGCGGEAQAGERTGMRPARSLA